MSRIVFEAGASFLDITPSIGTPLSGFIARTSPSTGIANRLFVRTLVVRSDGSITALCTFDLLGLSEELVEAIRKRAEQRTGIPQENILLACTHTHSGPQTMFLRGCQMASREYQEELICKAVSCIAAAVEAKRPARVGWAKAKIQLGINRREVTPDGVVLGQNPSGPISPFLHILKVSDLSFKDICILFSHAVHPYILGGDSTLISSDFPGFACEAIENACEGAVAMFTNGCAGNIAPRKAFGTLDDAKAEGEKLAQAVINASQKIIPQIPSPLACISKKIVLPMSPLPTLQHFEALLAQAERTIRKEERSNPQVIKQLTKAMEDWAEELRMVIRGSKPLSPVLCEIQCIRIGFNALVGISGEPFVEIGQQIESTSPFAMTTVLGYCNAYIGYIPTAKAFSEGGYEVNDAYRFLGTWTLTPKAEGMILNTAQQLLSELR